MRLPFGLPQSSDDAALWWATRRLSDADRFSHQRAFEHWLGQPGNAEAWAKLQAQDDVLEALAGDPEIRAMRREALAQRQGPGSRRRAGLGMMALAASLAALIAIPVLTLDEAASPTGSIAASEPALRLAAARGERRTFHLKDGSRISLNAGSIVEARYSPGARDLRLVAGQALFHVAPDKARPFTVSAASQMVTATGTAFDVAIRADGSVRVALLEGHVRVEPSRRSGLARFIPALARETLDPGQQLTASAHKAPEISVGDVEQATAWNRGLVILRDERLGDALDEFNLYADRQIVALGPDLQDLKVSGMFAVDASDDFLLALQNLYPIRVDDTGRNIVIRWRPTVQRPTREKS